MKKIRWSIKEKNRLREICDKEWDWYFPGYHWVAKELNSEFRNNRSPEACRKMDYKFFRRQPDLIHET